MKIRTLCWVPVAGALALAGCDRDWSTVFTQQVEALELSADMRIQLHRSTEATQRAIMADDDRLSAEFSQEAQQAAAALETDLRSLEPIVAEIGSREEVRLLQEFATAFARLQEIDRELLGLAAENTNAKAERLAFGPAREAADGIAEHAERAARSAPAANALRAQLLAAQVQLAVREIQALQAPHIAEPDDAVMTQIEQQMAGLESAARASLSELSEALGSTGGPELGAAREQLDRFGQIHAEILALSRHNTDVRSLAAALGEKRLLTAACDAALLALRDLLSKHGAQATR
jgi:hypothetical protein